MRVQTVIKNLASAALVNDLLSSGDEVVLWRESATGNMFVRLSNGTDAPITSAGSTVLIGGLDPTGNIDFPAATLGNWWFFTADGTIGAPAIDVNEGDTLTCITTTAGGAGAAADFVIGEHNILQASETVVGVSRFSTIAELIAGVLDNVGISPKNIIDLLTVTGLAKIRANRVEPQLETDTMTVSTQDRTVAGANALNASYAAGKGGDDAAAGGEGGDSSLTPGAGGDATGAGGVGGRGGDGVIFGSKGGDDTEGGSGTGGDGGDAVLRPGAPGVGATNGKRGFAVREGIDKVRSETAIVAKGGGGQDAALALVGTYNKVDTVATLADSVTLPEAIASGPVGEITGMDMVVVNSSAANSMDVFPFTGEQIDGAGANVAIPVAAGSFIRLHCFVSGEWELV